MVLTSTFLGLNGVDRSSWVSKVEVAVEVEEKDVTTFASAGWKEVLGGLKSGSIAVTFKNDVADSQLDDTMWALLGTVVAFETRATSAVVGTSNPKYTGNVLINGWTPISGSPGDVNEQSVTYPTSGAVTRAEA
jgi:predicted secreted protein